MVFVFFFFGALFLFSTLFCWGFFSAYIKMFAVKFCGVLHRPFFLGFVFYIFFFVVRFSMLCRHVHCDYFFLLAPSLVAFWNSFHAQILKFIHLEGRTLMLLKFVRKLTLTLFQIKQEIFSEEEAAPKKKIRFNLKRLQIVFIAFFL